MKHSCYIAIIFLLLIMTACEEQELAHVEILTYPVTNITSMEATMNGSLTVFGDATISQKGFCYSKQSSPTRENAEIVLCETEAFKVKLSRLEEDTHYFVRAFAQNVYSIQYGEVVEFSTTKQMIPIVETTTPRGVTTSDAICGGNVTRSGEAEVIERGICYSTSSTTPTTSGTHVVAAVAGTGKYECVLGALTTGTTYYVRAYAKNQYGVAYGEVQKFTTLGHYLYVEDRTGWDYLCVYAWGDSELYGQWPGQKAIRETKIEGITYKMFPLNVPTSCDYNLIFSNWYDDSPSPGYNRMQIQETFHVGMAKDYYLILTSTSITLVR